MLKDTRDPRLVVVDADARWMVLYRRDCEEMVVKLEVNKHASAVVVV